MNILNSQFFLFSSFKKEGVFWQTLHTTKDIQKIQHKELDNTIQAKVDILLQGFLGSWFILKSVPQRRKI